MRSDGSSGARPTQRARSALPALRCARAASRRAVMAPAGRGERDPRERTELRGEWGRTTRHAAAT